MDPFDGMDLFARVVEAGSFTRAAETLGVGKSSVSERIAGLERRLGVRLLDRTTRRLTPTEAGRLFYERARQAREAAEAAHSEIQALQSEPAGLLRVGAVELLTRLHLVPALSAFLADNPLMRIEFVESVAAQNLVEEGLDLAIRITAAPSPSTVVRRIGTSRVVIVASRDYVDRNGAPIHPSEISRHRTIGFAPLIWGREWTFQTPEGEVKTPVSPVMLTNSAEAMRAAALAGLGFTAIPYWAVSDLLREGALVEALADYATPQSGIYAVYPSNRMIAPKVKRYADHVAKTLRAAGLGAAESV